MWWLAGLEKKKAMNDRLLRVLNTLSLGFTLFVNYWVNTSGNPGRSVGEISDAYPTLITPAGYAFAIWGIIYLLLISFVVFQWSGKRPGDLISRVGPWFIVSNLANAAWIFAFLHEEFWLSVAFMFILLSSLLALVWRLQIAIWDGGLRIIFFVWWPIAIYLGWIVTASVVNVAATLVASGWDGLGLSESTWGILMIAVATAVYLLLTFKRNLRESAGVGCWALVAIIVARGDGAPMVTTTAWMAVGILALAIAVHGFRGRATSPFLKWKRGEW